MEKNRFDRLVELRDVLETAIAKCESKRDLAALARQYRETLKEIEEIEGTGEDDEITQIIRQREADGKSGAVRKNRAAI